EPEDLKILQDVQAVAWECLRQEYRYSPASRTAVVQALAALDPAEPEVRLNRLVAPLRLLRSLAGDRLGLPSDVLAGYLAGLDLVGYFREDRERWKQFFDCAEQRRQDQPRCVHSFLLAVRDCCLALRSRVRLPDFVLHSLAGLITSDQVMIKWVN